MVTTSPHMAGVQRGVEEGEHAERSLCDGLSGIYSVGFHTAAVFIILVVSLIGTALPLLSKYVPALASNPYYFAVGKTAATGVLLSVATIHLINEAALSFQEKCVPPAFKSYNAFAFLFALSATLMMQGLDLQLALIAERWLRARHAAKDVVVVAGPDGSVYPDLAHSPVPHGTSDLASRLTSHVDCTGRQLHEDGRCVDETVATTTTRSAVADSGGELLDAAVLSYVALPATSRAARVTIVTAPAPRTSPLPITLSDTTTATTVEAMQSALGSGLVTTQCAQLVPSCATETRTVPVRLPTEDGASVAESVPHGHTHELVIPPAEMSAVRRVISAVCMEFGVTLHSVFVGLAVGLTTDAELKPLLVALVFHQLFEGMAMGSRLADASFHGWLEIVLAFVFAVSAPAGIAVGIIAAVASPTTMSGGGFVTMLAILDSFCGGILLYLAFTLLLFDFADDLRTYTADGLPFRRQRKCGLFMALWVGMLLMAAVGNWL